MGGSSIICPSGGKNCYLSMRGKDSDWLQHKASELAELASYKPFTIERTNRWHSLCYPVFSEFREEFYSGNKRKLNLETLNLISDVGFAIWYGDCGKIQNKHVIINTHIWGESGTNIVHEYFKDLQYSSEIIKERSSFRVKLDRPSSLSFLKIAEPQLPLWMATKVQRDLLQ